MKKRAGKRWKCAKCKNCVRKGTQAMLRIGVYRIGFASRFCLFKQHERTVLKLKSATNVVSENASDSPFTPIIIPRIKTAYALIYGIHIRFLEKWVGNRHPSLAYCLFYLIGYANAPG